MVAIVNLAKVLILVYAFYEYGVVPALLCAAMAFRYISYGRESW